MKPDRAAPVGQEPGARSVMSEVNGTRFTLRDGSEVLVRAVHSADAPLLADGFARLSAESRKLRFLSDKKHLSEEEVRYFTDVDHHDHEAIGAQDEVSGRGVGVARYIRDADDPEVAEIAVTVVDDWQRRGLGSLLLTRLIGRAREEGIRRFIALVAADNEAMASLLANVGAEVRVTDREAGTVEYEITPSSEAAGGALHDLLRAFASRELRPPGPIRDVLVVLVPDRFSPRDDQ
jgi:RimJ/RimL family protein N-acetyltransferase